MQCLFMVTINCPFGTYSDDTNHLGARIAIARLNVVSRYITHIRRIFHMSEMPYNFACFSLIIQDYSRKITRPDQVKMQPKIHFAKHTLYFGI
jgi:hypothetical protein